MDKVRDSPNRISLRNRNGSQAMALAKVNRLSKDFLHPMLMPRGRSLGRVWFIHFNKDGFAGPSCDIGTNQSLGSFAVPEEVVNTSTATTVNRCNMLFFMGKRERSNSATGP